MSSMLGCGEGAIGLWRVDSDAVIGSGASVGMTMNGLLWVCHGIVG